MAYGAYFQVTRDLQLLGHIFHPRFFSLSSVWKTHLSSARQLWLSEFWKYREKGKKKEKFQVLFLFQSPLFCTLALPLYTLSVIRDLLSRWKYCMELFFFFFFFWPQPAGALSLSLQCPLWTARSISRMHIPTTDIKACHSASDSPKALQGLNMQAVTSSPLLTFFKWEFWSLVHLFFLSQQAGICPGALWQQWNVNTFHKKALEPDHLSLFAHPTLLRLYIKWNEGP